MKVLVAEDDPVSCRMLERALLGWGFDVVIARDGLRAAEILRGPDAPKLLLLDWLMPGKNGIELCREIRARADDDYTYVLLLTSKHAQRDVVAGLESGADDYLTKPFNPQELQVRLRTGQRILRLMNQLVDAREAIRELSRVDALTGLLNRGAIIEALERELLRSNRDGSSVGVTIADVDHFKLINDTFGHPAGDRVLHAVGQTFKEAVRSYDSVGRYGGEEFLVVLPGCDELNAFSHAERMRKAISSLKVAAEVSAIQVTASFGVAISTPNHPLSAKELVAAADQALYVAKRNGRNHVEFAKPLVSVVNTPLMHECQI